MSNAIIKAQGGPTFRSPEYSDVHLVSVTGAEAAGGRYQDANQGLHTILEITPVADSTRRPLNVSLWLDFDDTKGWIYQGCWKLTTVGQVIRIGDPNLSTQGVPGSGVIWVPFPSHTDWKVAAIAGSVEETATPPAGFVQDTFTVAAVAACPATDITDAHFVPNPTTGDILQYARTDAGSWFWNYYEIDWTQPTISVDSNYWFSFITVQGGYEDSGGQWHPAPDKSGEDDDPIDHIYHGHWISDSGAIQGGISILGSVVEFRGDVPPNWPVPPAKNLDGTTNLYRTSRFWIYAVSRLGTDPAGGGSGTITLQTCWPGGFDHFDVTPAEQPAALDLTRTNPLTHGSVFGQVAGVFDIISNGIVADKINDAAIIARHFGTTIEPVGLINIAPDGNGEIIIAKTQATVFNQNDSHLYVWNGTDRYVRKITNLDFTAGIKAIEAVGSLPVSFVDYPAGAVVYLTTDEKLYRSNGAAWNKAVDGADLTALSVTTNALTAGCVTASKIAAHTITANEIAALTITAAELQAGCINASKMAVDSVVAGTIATGAIRAVDAVFETGAIKSADIESLACDKILAGTISVALSLTAPTITVTGTGSTFTVNIDSTNGIQLAHSSGDTATLVGGYLLSQNGDYTGTYAANFFRCRYMPGGAQGAEIGWSVLKTGDHEGNLTVYDSGGTQVLKVHAHSTNPYTDVGSAYNGAHLVAGSYHLWVDASGRLRIKSGAPASDTDGTIVGTQS